MSSAVKGVQKWPFVLFVAPSCHELQHEFTRVRKTNLIGRYRAGGIFKAWGEPELRVCVRVSDV